MLKKISTFAVQNVKISVLNEAYLMVRMAQYILEIQPSTLHWQNGYNKCLNFSSMLSCNLMILRGNILYWCWISPETIKLHGSFNVWHTYRISSNTAPGFYFAKCIFGWGSIQIWPKKSCVFIKSDYSY